MTKTGRTATQTSLIKAPDAGTKHNDRNLDFHRQSSRIAKVTGFCKKVKLNMWSAASRMQIRRQIWVMR